MDSDRLLTPEQAQQVILAQIRPLGVERLSLFEALGRVLAEDLLARRDIPPCDNSAMDGYAVRHADIQTATPEQPVILEVIEDIPAGRVGQRVVGVGQASRIMTGAPVPAGADAVVCVEDTRSADPSVGGRIEVLKPQPKGANIRCRGEDIAAGTLVLKAGTECGPAEIGTLAALQRPLVAVYRQPTLAVLSTGDELVEVDEPLAPGQIVNCNTYSLAALARAHGAVPLRLPIVRDCEEEIHRTIEMALAADFVLSSGGVSVGEYDYVKKVLEKMGAQALFWRVAMKPGKPLFFCLLQGKPYFGLPGNPVSSMISFLQFVRPAIRRATGYADGELFLPTARAILENRLYNRGDRRWYLRARLRFAEGHLRAVVPQGQGSHMLTSMLGANGLVILEPEQRAEPGEEVTVQIIDRIY